MFVRSLFCIVLILNCVSCEYISGHKSSLQPRDTIVDFSTVDVSPAFKECEQLLEKAKTNCFRTNIRQRFSKALQSFDISSDETIQETITVVLEISNTGRMQIKDIHDSDNLEENLPELYEILDSIITTMPTLLPATKRGIPVTTRYELPIKIKTRE